MKITSLPAIVLLALAACDYEPAIVPGYLHLDEIRVESDYALHGTASSKITTAWVEVDGLLQGAYELPALVPLPFEGLHNVKIYPGIKLNGISSLRNIYEAYLPIQEQLKIQPNADVYLNAAVDSIPRTTYDSSPFFTYNNLEDFESVGLSFEVSPKADTGLARTSDPILIFSDPKITESNSQSGLVVMPNQDFLFEAVTINEFTDFPQGGANIFLEMNYKTSLNVVVGVYRRSLSGTVQVPVVTLFPSENWNKVYINLVTEVSNFPDAEGFKLFLGAIKPVNGRSDTLLFDNIKLVY